MAEATALAAVWPSPQIDASRITCSRSASTASSSPLPRPRREPVQRLLLAHRADAAGDALAARLVAEELGDAQHRVDEIRRLVVDEHDAGAERHAGLARRLERELEVELVRPQERAGGAAEQHRLRRPRPREVEQLAAAACPAAARTRPAARRGRRRRTGACPRVAVADEDLRHVEQRLDVVHDGRLAEQPDLDRERRLVPRLAAVALDRLEERRLLAADVRAGADAQLDVEREAGAENVVAEQARGARLGERVLEPRVRERVLRAHVDEAALAAGRVGRDRHRLDERERVALHQHPVLERPRLRLVGVADEVVRLRGLARDRLPLGAGRERGAAAAEQVRLRHRVEDAVAAELERAVERGVAAVRAVRVERLRVERRPRSGEAAGAPARPACGSGGPRSGSWISRGSGPAIVRSAAGARSQSPRHGLGSAPSGDVRAGERGRRGRCRRASRRRAAPRARSARRSWRRRTHRRAARRAGGTRSRARPRSPSRRAAAPRAAPAAAGGGGRGRRGRRGGRSRPAAPATASIASRSASVGSAVSRRMSIRAPPAGSPSP